MRKRVGLFKIRIRFNEHLCSLSLTFCPFVGRFEKQVSAASQQRLVSVTICKHNWSVCFTLAFCFFSGIRVCLNGIPSMGDTYFFSSPIRISASVTTSAATPFTNLPQIYRVSGAPAPCRTGAPRAMSLYRGKCTRSKRSTSIMSI